MFIADIGGSRPLVSEAHVHTHLTPRKLVPLLPFFPCFSVLPPRVLTLNVSTQLELHAHEQLDKAWRRLAKREAKAVQSESAHTPAAKQPEAVFLPEMLDEFLQVKLALHLDSPSARNMHSVLTCK